ncbi:MAG: DUF2933 domain-containing protein [Betaproteobacteria bacterium]|nr:DUF2933 domain-containing protein [Betaproteobacteria bacterium]
MVESLKEREKPFLRSRAGIGLLVFGGVAAFFFIVEHRAHALGALPFLLLLACPLMHVFMHGRHGGHAGHTPDPPRAADRDLPAPAADSSAAPGAPKDREDARGQTP